MKTKTCYSMDDVACVINHNFTNLNRRATSASNKINTLALIIGVAMGYQIWENRQVKARLYKLQDQYSTLYARYQLDHLMKKSEEDDFLS